MCETWQGKANRIISILSLHAFKEANPKPNRKAKFYRMPDLASELVECLNTDDEIRAKALFLSYDGLKAIKK